MSARASPTVWSLVSSRLGTTGMVQSTWLRVGDASPQEKHPHFPCCVFTPRIAQAIKRGLLPAHLHCKVFGSGVDAVLGQPGWTVRSAGAAVSFCRQWLLPIYFRVEEGDGESSAEHRSDAACCDTCTLCWPGAPSCESSADGGPCHAETLSLAGLGHPQRKGRGHSMSPGTLPKLLMWEVCTWWRCLTVCQAIKRTCMGDFSSFYSLP